MGKSYFITATGTDLGKTWLCAGLIAACREQDRPVRAIKPVVSGYDPARHAESDLARIGAGRTAWCYQAPFSPDLAAAKEGKSIDFDALVAWCRDEIATNDGLLLIEGVGGMMVPLTAQHTVRDWIVALEVPTLLVAGTHLGALSHTLTALAALREVGIRPARLIVNETADSTVSVEETLASLTPHVGDIPIVALRRDDAAGLARLASSL
ncbi:dethiobiotin synthase [Sulfuricystis multivorans]|uniref:dethiobiotin synthase n=1 Tax=Sulfuricystis multivorans TaxID=2211108 RepID=UPI000F8302E2|nr:dethiobiotin synthase [Sulfuricystis multivorans]